MCWSCERARVSRASRPAAVKARKAPEAGELAGWLFFPGGAERIVVCEGAEVRLAGVAWCARVQPDSSLQLEAVASSDNRAEACAHAREAVVTELARRREDREAISQAIVRLGRQIEEVLCFGR